MIDSGAAEKAADFLRETAEQMGELWQQARMKQSLVKHTKGLLVKMQDNSKTPVSVRQDYAMAEDKYREAIEEDAIAFGEATKLDARRDAAKTVISLYQSMVKDRL